MSFPAPCLRTVLPDRFPNLVAFCRSIHSGGVHTDYGPRVEPTTKSVINLVYQIIKRISPPLIL